MSQADKPDKPIAPLTTKAPRQLNTATRNGTINGTAMLPMLAPELKIPVASARSRLGNHSATVLIQAGKLAASPRPSKNMATPKVTTENAKRRQHGCDAPEADGDRKCLARAQLVSKSAGHHHANGISSLERSEDVTVLDAIEAGDHALKKLFKIGDDSAVDVGDDRGEEQGGSRLPSANATCASPERDSQEEAMESEPCGLISNSSSGATWSDQLYRPDCGADLPWLGERSAAGLRCGSSESSSSRQAPVTTEESATLKSGQW
jgi:hypothetical protein